MTSSPMTQRSVSLPVTPQSTSPDTSIEILFNIPTEVRIISFTATAPALASPRNDSKTRHGEEGMSGLSRTSRFERTIAIGPLRIYRAPGSVAFLKCASALRPILPKSKCWVVDEDANTFILQVNPPQYWRIQVPPVRNNGRRWGQDLKDVFAKVLMFEQTPCPFQRNFTVDLPSPPPTPLKKRPWRPIVRPQLSVLQADSNHRQTTKYQSDDAPKQPVVDPSCEKLLQSKAGAEQTPGDIKVVASPSRLDSEEVTMFVSEMGQKICVPPQSHRQGEDVGGEQSCVPTQARTSGEAVIEPQVLKQCSRTITAPPLLSLLTSPPSKRNVPPSSLSPPGTSSHGSASENSSSAHSFHTIHSWRSSISDHSSDDDHPICSSVDTFPFPHNNITVSTRFEHSQDTSELTLTPGIEPPKTPPLLEYDDKSDEERDEIATPSSRSRTRHRATTSSNSHRRALSPLPAAVNLFSPPDRPRRLKTARHLPTAIVQKTCEILLGPPCRLLHLMLSIAAKIVAGEWKGVLSGHGESVHWDLTRDEYIDEDDYGISLPCCETKKKEENVREGLGESWEVD